VCVVSGLEQQCQSFEVGLSSVYGTSFKVHLISLLTSDTHIHMRILRYIQKLATPVKDGLQILSITIYPSVLSRVHNDEIYISMFYYYVLLILCRG